MNMLSSKLLTVTLGLAFLIACGRDTTPADVRPVGVGSDPDEIGPSPTPLGGVVGYDNIELAGGGLALAHMGLGSFTEVGPGFASFAPPYRAIIGFSYLFDAKLPAASTLSNTAPVPPEVEGTCYTVYSPEGPIGSFNTVDVGDRMEFVSADGLKKFRMGRVPYDIPPDAQSLFVYYSSIEPWTPAARAHKVPGADPNDPRAMVEESYVSPNFPFGEEMQFRFPGGVTRRDQPISSIPRPSNASATPAAITLPGDIAPLIQWTGPRYDAEGEVISDGEHSQCIEFYGDGRATPPGTPEDCAGTAPVYPTDKSEWDSFPGQVYTAPWEAEDGKIHLEWVPGNNGEQVTFAVRFMQPPGVDDPNYQHAEHEGREATVCEQAEQNFVTDEDIFDSPAMQGDPFSRTVEVSCLFEDDGAEDIDVSMFADALEYAQTHAIGGAIFYVGRGVEVQVEVPDVKDAYDQRHEISPIGVSSRVVKVGRFHWDASMIGGGE